MPNIELIGFSDTDAGIVMNRIKELLASESKLDKVVFTVYEGSKVIVAVNGQERPYLRFLSCYSDDHSLARSINLKIGLDVEFVRIQDFFDCSGKWPNTDGR